MLKLGVIGAGRMGTIHANSLKDNSEACIYGVYDPAEQTAQNYAARFNVKKIYPSLQHLAADDALDGVLICNYSDQHYDTMVRLLNAGKKRIFCEKALVRKLSDGEDLLHRVEKAGALVMVGHHRRYVSGYAAMQKCITEGKLGRIRMAKTAVCVASYSRTWEDFFASFERSGGVTLDMLSHIFDLLNWYFGDPDSVCGQSLMFDSSQPLPVDFVCGALTYKAGPICSIEGSWQRYGVGYDKIEVYGDEASAVFDGGDKLHIYRKNEHTELNVGNPPPYVSEMNAFIRMIKTGEKPINGLKEGFNSARVAFGMIEACKTGKTFKFTSSF